MPRMLISSKETPIPYALVAILAVACGLAIANIYYNQPLLPLFAASFGRSAAEAGFIATLTQLSYAVGMLLFVPLGDRVSRRRLILTLLGINTVSLIGAAVAPAFGVLIAASVTLGLTSVSASIIIPAAAALAAPSQRGRVVGILMTGLTSGILLARTISGFVGTHAGWRTMYWIATALDVLLLGLIAWRLPAVAPTTDISYGKLLRSLWTLLRVEPVLRIAAATGALIFAACSSFWSALAFLIARPPFGYGSDVAGTFGLAALFGIVASTPIGWLADRYGPRPVWLIGAFTVIAAFAGVAGAENRIWLLVVAAVLLELGNRTSLIANQTSIYSLATDARSRLNTVFVGSYFMGGAAGSVVGAAAAGFGGCTGLALAGSVFAFAALTVHLLYGTRQGLRALPEGNCE